MFTATTVSISICSITHMSRRPQSPLASYPCPMTSSCVQSSASLLRGCAGAPCAAPPTSQQRPLGQQDPHGWGEQRSPRVCSPATPTGRRGLHCRGGNNLNSWTKLSLPSRLNASHHAHLFLPQLILIVGVDGLAQNALTSAILQIM